MPKHVADNTRSENLTPTTADEIIQQFENANEQLLIAIAADNEANIGHFDKVIERAIDKMLAPNEFEKDCRLKLFKFAHTHLVMKQSEASGHANRLITALLEEIRQKS